MKKVIKIMSLLMAMILTVTVLSGCSIFMGEVENPEEVTLSMKIGVPFDENDPEWADWVDQLEYVAQDVFDYSNIKITYVKVPTEPGDAMDDFIDQVIDGDIACFMSGRGEMIDQLIEEEALISVESMRGSYDTIMADVSETFYHLSQEVDLNNYMIPLYCSYQALYYNRSMLKQYNLPNPDSWENVQTIIEGLKKEGITPISAGFADEGLEYMIDEMILNEGGTAEHSYMPVNGIMSSWERAVDDIRALEASGAFTKDCYNVTFEQAKQDFLNGNAGMIVAPSTSFGGELSVDDVKGIPFPVSETGKRETGAFIGRAEMGMYVSNAYFRQSNARYSAVIVDLIGEDYLGGSVIYDLFKNESTLKMDPMYYSDFLVDKTILEDSKSKVISETTAGDYPMRDHALGMDALVEGFREALTCKESEIDEILLRISKAETALQDAARAEAEED